METTYRLRAPTFTSLKFSDWQHCTVDGIAVSGEVQGDHEVRCTASFTGVGSGGFHSGVQRSLASKRAGARRFYAMTMTLVADASLWRRVHPYAVGGSFYVARTNDSRTGGVYAFPLTVGAVLGLTYVGFRAGPAFTTCRESSCEAVEGDATFGNGLLFGLEARSYFVNRGRSEGFMGGLGARIDETVTWLPTRGGLTRLSWFSAMSTIHFGAAERGWARDPVSSLEGELGLGVTLARSDGAIRGGFALSLALNVLVGL